MPKQCCRTNGWMPSCSVLGTWRQKWGSTGSGRHPQVVAAMEHVIEIALSRNLPIEPAIYPKNRAEYQQHRERGLQLFGSLRSPEYSLLREAAAQAMSIYR